MTEAKQDKPQCESAFVSTSLKSICDKTPMDNHSTDINRRPKYTVTHAQLSKALVQELLMRLQCQPFTSNFVLHALLGEVSNIDIYKSYEPMI